MSRRLISFYWSHLIFAAPIGTPDMGATDRALILEDDYDSEYR